MPKESRRSTIDWCGRCGNPPPCWYDNIAPGEQATWLCRDCIRIRNVVYKRRLDIKEYEPLYRKTENCPICRRHLEGIDKHADVSPRGELRGIVCGSCIRILNAAKEDQGLLTRMTVYMGLPPRHKYLQDVKGNSDERQ